MIQTQNKYRYELMSWVKENCLPLVELLNICQRGKKSIYSKSSKANSDSRGDEVNEGNVTQKRGKYSPLLSAGTMYEYVRLDRDPVIYSDQLHLKSIFRNSHLISLFPVNKDPSPHLLSWFRYLEKELERSVSPKQNINVKRQTSTRSLLAHM